MPGRKRRGGASAGGLPHSKGQNHRGELHMGVTSSGARSMYSLTPRSCLGSSTRRYVGGGDDDDDDDAVGNADDNDNALLPISPLKLGKSRAECCRCKGADVLIPSLEESFDGLETESSPLDRSSASTAEKRFLLYLELGTLAATWAFRKEWAVLGCV